MDVISIGGWLHAASRLLLKGIELIGLTERGQISREVYPEQYITLQYVKVGKMTSKFHSPGENSTRLW